MLSVPPIFWIYCRRMKRKRLNLLILLLSNNGNFHAHWILTHVNELWVDMLLIFHAMLSQFWSVKYSELDRYLLYCKLSYRRGTFIVPYTWDTTHIPLIDPQKILKMRCPLNQPTKFLFYKYEKSVVKLLT